MDLLAPMANQYLYLYLDLYFCLPSSFGLYIHVHANPPRLRFLPLIPILCSSHSFIQYLFPRSNSSISKASRIPSLLILRIEGKLITFFLLDSSDHHGAISTRPS